MTRIIKFRVDRDFDRLEEYLRNHYLEYPAADSWLPERLHDLSNQI